MADAVAVAVQNAVAFVIRVRAGNDVAAGAIRAAAFFGGKFGAFSNERFNTKTNTCGGIDAGDRCRGGVAGVFAGSGGQTQPQGRGGRRT